LAGFVIGFADALFDPAVWWRIVSQNWQEIMWLIVGIVAAPAKVLKPIVNALRRIPLAGRFAAWLIESIHSFGRRVTGPVLGFFRDLAARFLEGFVTAIGKSGAGLFPKLRGVITDAIRRLVNFNIAFRKRALEWMENLGKTIALHGPRQVIDRPGD